MVSYSQLHEMVTTDLEDYRDIRRVFWLGLLALDQPKGLSLQMLSYLDQMWSLITRANGATTDEIHAVTQHPKYLTHQDYLHKLCKLGVLKRKNRHYALNVSYFRKKERSFR